MFILFGLEALNVNKISKIYVEGKKMVIEFCFDSKNHYNTCYYNVVYLTEDFAKKAFTKLMIDIEKRNHVASVSNEGAVKERSKVL